MKRALLAIMFILAWSGPSWAYLDPGTGSMVLQGLAASLAVAGGFVSMSWQKIKGLALRVLRRGPKAKKDAENQ
jgi:hypothetical protein